MVTETADIKYTRACADVERMYAANQTHTTDYAHAVDAMLINAPSFHRAELLNMAVERGYCPAPIAYLANGEPLWELGAVAKFYGLDCFDASHKLDERGAEQFVISNRGIL